MKAFAFGTALTIACSLSISGIAVAKGSGGHSSGGHAGGQASAGQAGGRTHGSSAPHAGTGGRGTGTTPGTSARQPARSRDRQPVVGTAIPRPSAPATFLPGPLFYTPYRMWPYGGAVGLGGLGLRGVFEPFWLGYPSWDAYGPTGLYPGYWASGYSPYPFEAPGLTGGLRLKIQPEEAQVYVDGYYSGIVDDFNGHFQHLDLPPGLHHVEVRAPGRQSLEVDVMIQARHTTVYKGTLAPLTP